MLSGRPRGTVLLTAMFVLLCIHALVTIILASLRIDTALLKTSDSRLSASLKAQSAVVCALDLLESESGTDWEALHTVAAGPPPLEPPPEAARISVDDTASHEGPACQAWIQETDDPSLRKVWGAAHDGQAWRFSTAVTVRRELQPGLLFGVRNNGGNDQVFQRSMGDDEEWKQAPDLVALDWASGEPTPLDNRSFWAASADKEGRMYILSGAASLSAEHHVYVLDSSRGSSGEWGVLPELPGAFRADPTGLAVSKNSLFVAGYDVDSGQAKLLSLAEPEGSIRFPGQAPTFPGTWQEFERLPPSFTISDDGIRINGDAPYHLSGLQTDDEGALYVHLVVARNETTGEKHTAFARYAEGKWSFFPQPPGLSENAVLRHFQPPEVDDLGNVLTYSLGASQSNDRVYRFSPSGTIKNGIFAGRWKALPLTLPSDNGQTGRLRSLTVDSEGYLFLGFKTEDGPRSVFDRLLRYPLRSSQSEVSQELDLPDASEGKLHSVEAGGQKSRGQLEYLPVSWY